MIARLLQLSGGERRSSGAAVKGEVEVAGKAAAEEAGQCEEGKSECVEPVARVACSPLLSSAVPSDHSSAASHGVMLVSLAPPPPLLLHTTCPTMPTDELVPTFQPAPGPAMTSDAELRRQFGVAVRWFQDRSIILPVTPTARDRLFFYGRFKQATLGDNVLPCPSIFSPLRRYMWTAWDQQRGKSREQAMREYLHRIDEEMATFDFTRLNAQQMEWRDRFVQEMDREELRRALQDNDRRGSAASPLRPARQGDGQLREQKREDNQHSALERQPLGKAAHEEEHKEPPAPPLSAVNSPSAVLPTSPLRPSGRASPTSHLSPGSTERTVASVSASLSSLTSSLAVPTSTAQKGGGLAGRADLAPDPPHPAQPAGPSAVEGRRASTPSAHRPHTAGAGRHSTQSGGRGEEGGAWTGVGDRPVGGGRRSRGGVRSVVVVAAVGESTPACHSEVATSMRSLFYIDR